ncbi:helix-turn-helix domain-containing protein [Bifidobacterium breve]|uniref:helix-turn-helix domain-containing protein n=1 Tax=Bifidobacterium breve TaxID=1685 RepID=UPI00349EE468
MSNIALSWAFKCHVGNASAKAVLVYLADRADDDGTAAYPKIATIVNVTELSERTVRAALKTLQERGFIRRGDQRYARLGKGGRNRLPQYCQSCGTSRSNPTRRPSNGSRRRTRRNTTRRPWAIPWTLPPPPSWKTANPRT